MFAAYSSVTKPVNLPYSDICMKCPHEHLAQIVLRANVGQGRPHRTETVEKVNKNKRETLSSLSLVLSY